MCLQEIKATADLEKLISFLSYSHNLTNLFANFPFDVPSGVVVKKNQMGTLKI